MIINFGFPVEPIKKFEEQIQTSPTQFKDFPANIFLRTKIENSITLTYAIWHSRISIVGDSLLKDIAIENRKMSEITLCIILTLFGQLLNLKNRHINSDHEELTCKLWALVGNINIWYNIA